ncbi:YdcF family protein [Actinoplanes sp. NPDC049316]|uniref:YdcF family protein n=1 Tax=Actinoplanes sp. NPDC049316 TaxID=3154727 RepID=UPI003432EE77
MTPPTAAALLVFGRGVTCATGRYALTPASLARVRAAAGYVERHHGAWSRAVPVIFSGGWAEACEGAPEPPVGSREGDLMLAAARSLGLGRWADLRAETRSRSTLENLLHTVEDGLLSGYAFDPARPLGLVSHPWHLPRIRYLAGKVLGLPGSALLDVPVTGGADGAARGERLARAAVRVFLAGARDPAALRRRERHMVAWLRRAERLRLRRATPDEVTDLTRSVLGGRV